MEAWESSLKKCITSPEELAGLFHAPGEELAEVARRYPMRITPYYLGLIREAGDPIWRQCVPDPAELHDLAQSPDPLDEERLSPVPGLIHRYPDRVVFLVSTACAVYCRFCMRKRGVGCQGMSPAPVDEAVAYIASKPQIRDVILSGGDPLLLSDDRLDQILTALRRIPHVEIIRIGTRAPVTLPERVTARLARMLKRHQPLYVNTHFNHPREITGPSARACARLADAGIQLGNQSVLLKGVNDDPRVMRELMQRLLAIRVRPYYIHQMDLVRGTAHFRTRVADGIGVVSALRGHTSGLAVPHYVIDLPGGKGKVEVASARFSADGSRLLVRNYLGEEIEYPET
ncbi:KamA family radical SAM protein [Geomonas subterranea]|uniref:KamA family radical SAM protein n=1 Tax=Geomonas subterranea TaxID=2847989 RepID=A0ABX8LN64_9BACT|nr:MULTISPECIES: KamA family radical SAM protein [Geomonas]QXE91764.1 KamA family radical SAM protein [Geomonas subterranea]QXM10143.1 KamA family radical SAM protein [Geomonas subterranea]